MMITAKCSTFRCRVIEGVSNENTDSEGDWSLSGQFLCGDSHPYGCGHLGDQVVVMV